MSYKAHRANMMNKNTFALRARRSLLCIEIENNMAHNGCLDKFEQLCKKRRNIGDQFFKVFTFQSQCIWVRPRRHTIHLINIDNLKNVDRINPIGPIDPPVHVRVAFALGLTAGVFTLGHSIYKFFKS